jgi:excisionase family DNA binding protein
MSANPARLHPDDVDAIARRVVELLCEAPGAGASPDTNDGADLLTADRVAEILHVTPRYVLRLGREGALERIKRPGGKGVLFPEAGVRRYLEQGRETRPMEIGAAAAHLDDQPPALSPVRLQRRDRL